MIESKCFCGHRNKYKHHIYFFLCFGSIHFYNLTSAVPPEALTQPLSVNTGVNKTATFTVVAFGEGLTYQWFGPGGTPLSDTPGEIAGATTTTLQIFNVQSSNAGSYHVRVSNAGGSVNSDSVSLIIGRNDFL